MKAVLILFIMLFLHVVDDFYLQGILAKMKQKTWWMDQLEVPHYIENYSDYEENKHEKFKYREWEMYKHDYIVALIIHAFSWSFMIQLPSLILIMTDHKSNVAMYLWFMVYNIFIHARVDNLKANKFAINLVQDQTTHMIQILATWLFLIVM